MRHDWTEEKIEELLSECLEAGEYPNSPFSEKEYSLLKKMQERFCECGRLNGREKFYIQKFWEKI